MRFRIRFHRCEKRAVGFCCLGDRIQPSVLILRVLPVDDLLYREIFQQHRNTVDMILVQMRQHQEIHAISPAGEQILPGFLSGVLRRKVTAAVYQKRFLSGKNGNALPLPHINGGKHNVCTFIVPTGAEQQRRQRQDRDCCRPEDFRPCGNRQKEKQQKHGVYACHPVNCIVAAGIQ